MATKKKGMSATTKVEIASGVLAAAAAAGAGYWFYGDKHAKKHRKAATTWARGMKTQVVKEAKKLKRLDQKAMAGIVDKAASLYQGARSVDAKDLRAAASELKRNWRAIQAEMGGMKKNVKRSAGKAVSSARKAASKAVSKAAKAPAKAKKSVRKAVKKAAKGSR